MKGFFKFGGKDRRNEQSAVSAASSGAAAAASSSSSSSPVVPLVAIDSPAALGDNTQVSHGQMQASTVVVYDATEMSQMGGRTPEEYLRHLRSDRVIISAHSDKLLVFKDLCGVDASQSGGTTVFYMCQNGKPDIAGNADKVQKRVKVERTNKGGVLLHVNGNNGGNWSTEPPIDLTQNPIFLATLKLAQTGDAAAKAEVAEKLKLSVDHSFFKYMALVNLDTGVFEGLRGAGVDPQALGLMSHAERIDSAFTVVSSVVRTLGGQAAIACSRTSPNFEGAALDRYLVMPGSAGYAAARGSIGTVGSAYEYALVKNNDAPASRPDGVQQFLIADARGVLDKGEGVDGKPLPNAVLFNRAQYEADIKKQHALELVSALISAKSVDPRLVPSHEFATAGLNNFSRIHSNPYHNIGRQLAPIYYDAARDLVENGTILLADPKNPGKFIKLPVQTAFAQITLTANSVMQDARGVGTASLPAVSRGYNDLYRPNEVKAGQINSAGTAADEIALPPNEGVINGASREAAAGVQAPNLVLLQGAGADYQAIAARNVAVKLNGNDIEVELSPALAVQMEAWLDKARDDALGLDGKRRLLTRQTGQVGTRSSIASAVSDRDRKIDARSVEEKIFDPEIYKDGHVFRAVLSEIKKSVAVSDFLDRSGGNIFHNIAAQAGLDNASKQERFRDAIIEGAIVEKVRIAAMLNQHNTSSGGTPLHTAAKTGDLDFVRFLLKNGAGKDQQNNEGKTPGEVALEAASLESDLAKRAKLEAVADELGARRGQDAARAH